MSYYRNKREEREKLANQCLDIISYFISHFDRINEEDSEFENIEMLEELRFKILRMI